MSKSAEEGLKELQEKQYYDYHKVKNISIDYDGKKVKFRVILKNQAQKLTKYNSLNFEQNRKALVRAFNDGGTVSMFKYYEEELAILVNEAEKELDKIKKQLNK